MFQLSELQLQSKNDIPFEAAKVMIHVPTAKEIGVIGEDLFWLGCEYLNFSKNNLKEQDKVRLEQLSDFEVLMVMMKNQNNVFNIQKHAFLMVLALIFPQYVIKLTPINILLNQQKEQKIIDRSNFEQFKIIIQQIFCLNQLHGSNTQYNVEGNLGKMLAEKFKRRQQFLAKKHGGQKKSINLLSRYISILSVGLKKDKNELLEYSVFQLFDEYHRFILHEEYEIVFRIKLAGGKDVKNAQDWMQDIHSNNEI